MLARSARTAYWRPSVADQPLAGRRIVVTRPEAKTLADELERLGAEVTIVPLIEIRPAEDRRALEEAIARLSDYDWIVLTSVNGVRAVEGGLAALAGPRVAAVGPVTADAIRSTGIEPAFVATRASEDIAGGLGDVAGKRILMPQADIAEPHLADELRGKGAEVDAVVAYRTVHVEPPMWGILPLRIADAVVLASGSACRSLAAAGGAGGGAMLVCIGPKTAKVAREVGLKVGLVADETTSDGIIRSLVSHFGES
jgi:uroporphyrinogen-III synthase